MEATDAQRASYTRRLVSAQISTSIFVCQQERALTLDIVAHSPRVSSLVSVLLYAGRSPRAETVEDGPILCLKSVSHCRVALGRVRFGVVVIGRTVIAGIFAGPIDIVTGVVEVIYAGIALVCPVGWHIAVVVF